MRVAKASRHRPGVAGQATYVSFLSRGGSGNERDRQRARLPAPTVPTGREGCWCPKVNVGLLWPVSLVYDMVYDSS